MDLSFSAEDQAFAQEVRAFLAEALPSDIRAKAEIDAPFDPEETMRWHRILFDKGWVAPGWPERFGGPGLSATQRFILTEELELAGTPPLSPFGLKMVGPAIMQFGTPEQQQRFLPKILSGEEVWCQGYSEPEAGSDLASLRCRADDDGDHLVINGQKTWTTYAQYADWIFCLVRTNANVKQQAGITFLLIDMKSPGVEARPMLTIGEQPAFCDTFFEDVRVPKANVVGPIDGGWTVAKALLGHERTLLAMVGSSQRLLRRVKRIAAETFESGRSLLEHPGWRTEIARMEIELEALQMANYRALAGAQLGKAPGAESSILKLRGTEINQQLYELAMKVMGLDALSWYNEAGVVPDMEQGVAPQFCYARATSIFGGSNEIQRNIIAKWILGLPSGK
ncbi:acyl-CoA dehydrogenase family protein [Paraliomyxa miuraensis]|uniref:acyl-CoA dehydrogenase family protein n=1 Tax=Paraliomyxa miuraensis TaxID=376150 RepID=UPI00224E130C|nr:acyl-CoA dehydrogenase family protein [Paraliomyxa miuraensis]MCX4242597.1 acyl-CoA dehydrogenase family protein [Paraliomyxa miuraensis]